jgi:purine-nucleoside phosphorylase
MPSRLRPTAPCAADAILTGDPGRALLLAQELLEQPKMSNHARGLWGYTGTALAGGELTIQSTGMGGPSAALVLADLAELGVRRAVRVGSCLGTRQEHPPGELLIVEEAIARGGSASAFELELGEAAEPDRALTAAIHEALGEDAEPVSIASHDVSPPEPEGADPGIAAADMQTVAVFARSRALDIAAAAVLVVVETLAGARLTDEQREAREKRAGRAVSEVLSASS